jgi:putative ABC transport system ATP-binding protein
LRLERVAKVYLGDEIETHALREIHLTVDEGEFVAIAGPSGSGKTTLLSLLGLLDVPSTGRYWLDGHDTSGMGATERAALRNREIGFVFQSFNLIADLSVYENVELPLVYRGMPRAERRARVLEVLARVDLANRVDHRPFALSGGQQQRVALARALVGRPRIVLADEPTGNLDSANGQAVMELLRELHRAGSTVCIVTHERELTRWAGRIIRLFDGRIVSEDATEAA